MRVRVAGGTFARASPPATLTGHEPAISAIPEVRKRTQAILAEFGYGDAEIAELGRDGAPYFYSDLIEVVEGSGEYLDGVLISKVEGPEDLYAVAALLN